MLTATFKGIRRNDERREDGKACPRAVEALIRDTHAVLTNCGVYMSASKVSRLVRAYKSKVEPNGFPFAAWLANNLELHEERRRAVASALARVIGYADPTGETAAYNVDRSRGWRC